jgi:hypothetical protein
LNVLKTVLSYAKLKWPIKYSPVVASFIQLVELTSPSKLLAVRTALRISGEALEAVLCLRSSNWTDEDLAARVGACAHFIGQQMSALLAVLVALPDLLPHHINSRAQEHKAKELLLGEYGHCVLLFCPLVRTMRHIAAGGIGKHASANAELEQVALHAPLRLLVKSAQHELKHGANGVQAQPRTRGSKMLSRPSATPRTCA